jgi:hypothetical protein
MTRPWPRPKPALSIDDIAGNSGFPRFPSVSTGNEPGLPRAVDGNSRVFRCSLLARCWRAPNQPTPFRYGWARSYRFPPVDGKAGPNGGPGHNSGLRSRHLRIAVTQSVTLAL